jgi:hypothetical protein
MWTWFGIVWRGGERRVGAEPDRPGDGEYSET